MRIILLSLTAIFLLSCDKMLLHEELENTSETNFESIWGEFDAKYGLFQAKQIDWDSVYTIYRPQVQPHTSPPELYSILTEMLAGLNDSHVALLPTSESGLPMYQSGVLGRIDTIQDFDLAQIRDHYFTEVRFEDPFFTYGILPNNIGYIHIEGFSDLPKYLEAPFETVLDYLKDTKGIVIDVRGGYGGEDIAGQYLAGRFTSETRTYMQTRVKSGAGENDFTDFEQWQIQPEGSYQYSQPIVVLTHRFTISARETFCLAMKALPQVMFVGDTTAGAFSNQINREMPNGWGYSLSIGEWLDANAVSYEGAGIAPDILIQNQKQDVLNGKDAALEKAIEILN